jgi:periplasmic divalent cation tolerance protein
MTDAAAEDRIVVAFSTVSDDAAAARIARALVEERLVACVNRIAGVVSTYRWEGALHEDPEVLMIMKTRRGRVAALEKRLGELHPYEVPELVVVEAAAVGEPYARWVRSMVADLAG